MKKYTVVFLLLSLLMALPAHAQSDLYSDAMRKKVEIYQRDMGRIESWLNHIHTMVAKFTQVAPNGERSTGTFYLSRPGKLRWEYDPPSPITIIAKGNVLTYYDKELEQVSYVSLDDTLANFLTRREINFADKDITITAFTKDNTDTAVTIAKSSNKDEGSLTLVFDSKSNELQRMEVTDATGKETKIYFDTIVLDVPLDEKLFTLPKFRGKK